MKNLAIILLFVMAYAKHEQYTGWSSYILEPSTEDQLSTLASVSHKYSLDFWVYPSLRREGVVIVKPEYQDGFFKVLEDNKITYRSHVVDVKAQLDSEVSLIEQKRDAFGRTGGVVEFSYDSYHRIETINKYMVNMSQRYPDKVKLVAPAKSFEGRRILYLKISTTNFKDMRKPIIFIDACVHAREWISTPTVTWAIKKLVENVTEPELLERFDWILLPVVNPDGYVYSLTKSPLWRKTRSTNQHKDSRKCPGVDANRNYAFAWDGPGKSEEPCEQDYGGNKPFSEIETRVVRDIMIKHLDRIAMYINMHSYGSLILHPWSYSMNSSPNEKNLRSVALNMAKTIRKNSAGYSKVYDVGSPPYLLYIVSGASTDYAHSIGIPFSYVFELPTYRSDGFHLRPSLIKQICFETWKGIEVGAIMVAKMYAGKINTTTHHLRR